MSKQAKQNKLAGTEYSWVELPLAILYYYGTHRTNYKKQKDHQDGDLFALVELAGTAPASVGLSWLVVYRHSLF